MKNKIAYELLESALPLRPPVPPAEYPAFVKAMVKVLGDSNTTVRLLSDSFDPHGVLRFISLFNGMTLQIPPRQYWNAVFRDVHIYTVLHATPKKANEEAWRKAVLALSRKYNLPPKTVVKISSTAKAAVRKDTRAENLSED